jgi:hypothetical protein
MLQPIARRLLLSLSLVSLASCEARRPAALAAAALPHSLRSAPTLPTSPRVPEARPSAAAAAPVSPALADLPKAIELAGKPACTWRTSAFRATIGTPGNDLRLRPGGPVFAQIDGGNVAITVPQGKAEVALFEASSEGIFVSGIADTASITLFPAKPFVMAGLVVPEGSADLKLTAADEDKARLKLALPNEVVVPSGALEEARPCGDVSADPSSFESKAPVFGSRAGSHLFMSGGLAELTLRPDGPRAATLRIPADGDFVHSFDERDGRSLIGWHTSTVMVFGWVRSARLQETNVGIGGTLGRGFGRRGRMRIKTVASVRCEHDLPLIGEADGEARTVGRILAGTTVRIARWGEPRSRVVVDVAGIRQEHGSFSARTAELRGCRDLAPPAP